VFRFKEFSVKQEKNAMKVGTDGDLHGAWSDGDNVNFALDIGCGTGLIALILAQKNVNIKIDAVEINAENAAEAVENVQNSPFAEQIFVFCTSIQDFAKNCDKKYDLIVSNPPFFVDSLKSPNEKRSLARHNDTLPYNDLIFVAEKLLTANGLFSVILPEEESENFIDFAKKCNLFLTKQTKVFSTPKSKCRRRLVSFSKTKSEQIFGKIIIEKSSNNFTDEYIALTKDFYLKF